VACNLSHGGRAAKKGDERNKTRLSSSALLVMPTSYRETPAPLDSQGRPIIKSNSEGRTIVTPSTTIIENMLQHGPISLHFIVSCLKNMGIHTVSKSTTSTSTKAMKMSEQMRRLGYLVQALPGKEKSQMYCWNPKVESGSLRDLKKKTAKALSIFSAKWMIEKKSRTQDQKVKVAGGEIKDSIEQTLNKEGKLKTSTSKLDHQRPIGKATRGTATSSPSTSSLPSSSSVIHESHHRPFQHYVRKKEEREVSSCRF
jgi:hypothetical protein